MKRLKKESSKGTPGVYPEKRPTQILLSVFFLAALIMLAAAPAAIAQSGPWATQSPVTLQEERILNHCRFAEQTGWKESAPVKEFRAEVEHYMRDGCKRALAGDWRWEQWGDIVTITYDEQHKVFLGDVKKPVEMDLRKGHRLFKVYFSPHNVLYPAAGGCDINYLRSLRTCFFREFTGTEFSFEQRTRKPTETRLVLILTGDRIEYKVEKYAYFLTRIK